MLQAIHGWRTGGRRVVLAGVVSGLLLTPMVALACGGCFTPATVTGAPVVQNAERILFARDEVTKRSHVWVEIRYAGPPGEFSWVVPLPKVPTVSVGDSWLFDRLDDATGPRYVVTYGANENCAVGSGSGGGGGGGGVGCGSTATSGGSASYTAGPPKSVLHRDRDKIDVLGHAQAGPYEYVIIQAKSQSDGAKSVVDWLTQNGYRVPDAAAPILASHVKRGDVFLALKLNAGATALEVRPIALEMDDAEPCVPLRLTSIAAQDDMSVVVTVAGPGRAIPKNHLHVQLNPARLDWLGGAANYGQVLAAAMDEAVGRAFVTEFAGPLPTLSSGTLEPAFDEDALDTAVLAQQTGKAAFWAQVVKQKLPITTGVAEIVQKYFELTHAGSDFAYYSALQKVPNGADGYVDGAALAAELEAEFCGPVRSMLNLLHKAKRVTRLDMRISPQEMTKDPVFAFAQKLPDVSSVHLAEANQVCSNRSFPDAVRLTLDDLGSWIIKGTTSMGIVTVNSATDPRFADAPAALRIEVLDEDSSVKTIDEAELQLVDLAIAGAHAGTPSLPDGLVLKKAKNRWIPPSSDLELPVYKANSSSAQPSSNSSSGCQQSLAGTPPMFWLLGLATLAIGLRRRFALSAQSTDSHPCCDPSRQ